ncbi:MAG: hypothetical protein CHACPFDD_04132 [Phycisphaerae bacterium]|nr:hypothetical protein [Phycisphaerae bacterium]
MTMLARINEAFVANWMTVFVGWEGLGRFSGWPDRWTEFPSLLTAEEIVTFWETRLMAEAGPQEEQLILRLLTVDLRNETRESVKDMLGALAALEGGDAGTELRKWRVILLEGVLESLPQDPVDGLIELTEFWQGFGFPADSPHVVQRRGNAIDARDHYQQDNFVGLLARHYAWLEAERAAIVAAARS